MTDPAEVLVVDDDVFNVQLLTELCQSAGHTVRSAPDGLKALEAIGERQPDLVLLDLMMPGLDGYEVLARLRADPQTEDLPVIIVTARADADARVRGVELGADDFVTKPFRFKDLRDRIAAALEQARLLGR